MTSCPVPDGWFAAPATSAYVAESATPLNHTIDPEESCHPHLERITGRIERFGTRAGGPPAGRRGR
jgi:hypothetical protein